MSIAWILAGWRAAFLFLEAPIVGGLVLLLVARLTGADWDTALRPLLKPMSWLVPLAVPVVIQQALFVSPPPHLMLWLWWPLFGARTLIALAFWWWVSRRVLAGALGKTGAGLALLGHAAIVDIVAVDWILGVAPAQPQTAIGMTLAVIQILAACAVACLMRSDSEHQARDLGRLMIAACLGVAYLLFVDFLVIWYGNIPARIGWYQVRMAAPWSVLPPIALVIGVTGPLAALVLRREGWAGGAALAGLLIVLIWLVAPIGGPIAILSALAAALLALPLRRLAR